MPPPKIQGQNLQRRTAARRADRSSRTAPRGSCSTAGDLRIEADEVEKAVEIWRSVIERYPKSRIRFDAHMRLGNFLLERQKAYDEARRHFQIAAGEDNPDGEIRAEAALKEGVCHYEAREYGKCFELMRGVIEQFPSSDHVNQAYYYIGLGHFRLGHYSRAIEALEKVGTAMSQKDVQVEKSEIGRRLHIKIDDKDLAILKPGESIRVVCRARSGDEESAECLPVGRNVHVVLGSLPTALGAPQKGNGRLEVRGGDLIDVLYIDQHTADLKVGVQRLKTVQVVGTARAEILDGSFREPIEGVVLGKGANLQVIDADFDTTPGADALVARAEIYREKTAEEIEDETAELAAKGELPAPGSAAEGEGADGEAGEDAGPMIDRYKRIDALDVRLIETPAPPPETEGDTGNGNATPAPAASDGVRSGIFRAIAPVEASANPVAGDALLQALPGDLVRLVYADERNLTPEPITIEAEAKAIEGNLGDVRVTKANISDEELRLRTQLRTASALTNIGNHYKEFGLDEKSKLKYGEALEVCEEIADAAQKLGGPVLEETYVQLWRIYFAMDQLGLAEAMSGRLLREFPESAFIDEAILQQARISQKREDYASAIQLYGSLVKLQLSPLRGEGQFGVAECYEAMALAAPAEQSEPLFDRAFTEYQKVYEQFPESGRVGEAVAKMANFYYQRKDYARAIDVFENVLGEHPDASFLDVILFNYGRCLYRLDRKADALRKFEQLIGDFPESELAPEAKRVADALLKASSAPAPEPAPTGEAGS
ncbi:MAG: tetratricopeptide repeat protein [Verrucomicrobiales bacterium]